MTYIDYLNDFNQWLETNALPASSQLLYYKLLYVFNRAGWPEDVGVDNLRLMVMLDGASKTTVIRARDKLISCGFIDYYKGKKGAPNRYALSLRYKNDTENATVYATKNDTENATVFDTTNATHIKTKTKKKETSPYGDEKKTAIAAVMAAYLNKVNPQMSERSRDELTGFVEVMGAECCLRAIDAALDAKKATWPYIRAILQAKQSQGVRCLADWDALEERRRGTQQTELAAKKPDPNDWEGFSV